MHIPFAYRTNTRVYYTKGRRPPTLLSAGGSGQPASPGAASF